jgi:hypothetical protein
MSQPTIGSRIRTPMIAPTISSVRRRSPMGRVGKKPKLWRRQHVATGGLLVGLGVYAAAAGHRTK